MSPVDSLSRRLRSGALDGLTLTTSGSQRETGSNDRLDAAIDEAIGRKPRGHDFAIDRRHRRPRSPAL